MPAEGWEVVLCPKDPLDDHPAQANRHPAPKSHASAVPRSIPQVEPSPLTSDLPRSGSGEGPGPVGRRAREAGSASPYQGPSSESHHC